jgi:hypothetical protein
MRRIPLIAFIPSCRDATEPRVLEARPVGAASLTRRVARSLALTGPTTCVAGASVTLTAVARDKGGKIVGDPALVWSASPQGLVTIQPAAGNRDVAVVACVVAGNATVTASWAIQTPALTATQAIVVTEVVVDPPVAPDASACVKVSGWAARTQPVLAKPGYLASVDDRVFGLRLTRVTGDPGGTIPTVGGTWPTIAYHNYAKDQPWSADQALIVLKQMRGTGVALFLDGTTYAPLFTRSGPPGGGEWRMHPVTADVAVNLTSGGEVRHWNVRTNASTVKVAAVAGYTANEMGPSEGNLSYDGAYLVAKAIRTSDAHLVARVLNIDAGTAGAVIDLTAANITNLDWVSVSAGGGYVAAYGVIDGANQRTKVWNRSTGALVGYWQDYTFGHYDLGLDASGNEVAFGAVGQSPYAHHFITRRLDNAAITDQSPAATSYNWHVSTRNVTRPGWGYAATNDRTGYALDGQVYAVKLDGSMTSERWAFHMANNTDYDSAPFPVPTPDGTRVMVASNWLSSTARPIQTYVVSCP